jgi:hypothetical protein
MTHNFKLARRIARLRASLFAALILALAGCDNANSLDPASDITPEAVDQALADDPISSIDEDTPLLEEEPEQFAAVDVPALASVSFAGGIPFGTSQQPNNEFGSVYNGALRNIYPQFLLSNLSTIRSRGGKVALMFAGPQHYYKDANGHFSLSKWKARVDRFRNVNFSSYINDGTIIGHYLIDEPQDAANWNGRPIPPSTLEEMARYSKERWPNMVTIARTWPDYLDNWSGSYRHLDAAWAAYVAKRFPDIDQFISSNVSKAKAKGLALIVGLNLRDGSPTKGRMSPSQVKSYGSALLSSTYPCAFISWKYDDNYLSSLSMRDAMRHLRNRAESRSFKSCRGS